MKTSSSLVSRALAAFAALLVGASTLISAADTKIVLVAGRPSHAAGEHEFRAGSLLMQLCLNRLPGIQAVVITNGWPVKVVDGQTVDDNAAFDGAAAVIFFMDGGSGHPVIARDHLKVVEALVQRGIGLGFFHYAVEVPLNNGGQQFLTWVGGFYETGVSTNPIWDAEVKSLPVHAITRGVKPFTVRDEWYFNLHFRPEMLGVTPILVATPSDMTRQGATSSPRGPHAHIVAGSGRQEVLAWASERPDGGRSFGFTGGHFHTNWANPDFRKLTLNSVFWMAKLDIPANGVESSPSVPELQQNLDPKGGRGGGAGVVTIPNLTPEQTTALADMEQALTEPTTAAANARTAIGTVAFGGSAAEITASIEALRAAELALATARANQFATIQSSATRLQANQVQALTLQGIRGGPRAGAAARRGGTPAATIQPAPATQP